MVEEGIVWTEVVAVVDPRDVVEVGVLEEGIAVTFWGCQLRKKISKGRRGRFLEKMCRIRREGLGESSRRRRI